ncbi:MAG: hypothetical protein ACOYEV_08535 [Candidatus Nanopelagicales bacterium]
MDVFLWFGSAASLVIAVFTAWMLSLGSTAFLAPGWGMAFRSAAEEEVQRRGLGGAVLKQSELVAIGAMCAAVGELVDSDADERLVAAMRAMVDPNDDGFTAELRRRRAQTLACALDQQVAAVRDIPDLVWASRVWRARRIWSQLGARAAGLRWFLPPFWARIRGIAEHYLNTATLLGLWLGLFYWGWARLTPNQQAVSGSDWLSFVGTVVTVAGILGLVVAVGGQPVVFARHLSGPESTWTRPSASRAAASAALIAGFWIIATTGLLQREMAATASSVERLSADRRVGHVLQVGVLALALGYLIRNGWQWVRSSRLRTSERIRMAVALFAIVSSAVLAVVIGLGPQAWVRSIGWVVFAVMMLGGVASAVVGVSEWIQQLRGLQAANWHFPWRELVRRVLWVWIVVSAAAFLLCAATVWGSGSPPPLEAPAAPFLLAMFGTICLVGAITATMVAFAAAAWLVARTVRKEYKRLHFRRSVAAAERVID